MKYSIVRQSMAKNGRGKSYSLVSQEATFDTLKDALEHLNAYAMAYVKCGDVFFDKNGEIVDLDKKEK